MKTAIKTNIRNENTFSAEVPGHGVFETTPEQYKAICKLTKPEILAMVCKAYADTQFNMAHWKTFRKEPLALIVASLGNVRGIPVEPVPSSVCSAAPEEAVEEHVHADDEEELEPVNMHRCRLVSGYCTSCGDHVSA